MAMRVGNLAALTEEQRAERMREICRVLRSEPNGEIKELDDEIAEFEHKHGMTSADMLQRRTAGGLDDDNFDFCRWVMVMELRDEMLGKRPARP